MLWDHPQASQLISLIIILIPDCTKNTSTYYKPDQPKYLETAQLLPVFDYPFFCKTSSSVKGGKQLEGHGSFYMDGRKREVLDSGYV